MHNLALFGRLSRFCARHAWLVIIVWLAVAATANVFVPQLERTVAEHSAPFTPENAATSALRQMSVDFGVPPSTAIGSVVVSSERRLDQADFDYYANLVRTLKADAGNVAYVLDTYGNADLGGLGLSPDGKAVNLNVATTGEVGSTAAHDSTQNVRAAIAALPRPDGLEVNFTGPSPTLADLFSSIDESLLIITGVSVLLITLLLLVVYRSLLTALIPLATIGISLGVARPIMSLAGTNGLMPVSNFTIALATAMVLGAGTDYAIFLLANHHESRRRGMSVDDSVASAGARTAGIVIASGLTIAGAGMAMIFAKVGMFRTAGPPIALSVAVTVAVCLTLTPALMALWGRRGWAEPRALDERRWRRRGATIIRRAPALVAASMVFLVATSAVLLTYRPNIDENAMQIHDTDSSVGYERVYQHWGVNEAAPEFVLVRADHDMRNTKDLAALDQIAAAVGNLPEVAHLRSITRPDGKPLPQTAIGYQTGQVAAGLTDARDRIEQKLPDVSRLAAGVTQLRDGAVVAGDRIPQLASGTEDVVTLVRSLLASLDDAERLVSRVSDGSLDVPTVLDNLSSALDALDGVRSRMATDHAAVSGAWAALQAVFEPLVGDQPPAACDAACIRARAAFADLDAATGGRTLAAINGAKIVAPLVSNDSVGRALEALPELRASVDRLRALSGSLGTGSTHQAGQRLDELVAGVRQLSAGMTRLTAGLKEVETGTDAMAATTRELANGLDVASDYLRGLSVNTSDGAGRGFYLPPQAQQDRRFVAGQQLLMSSDGHTARMMLTWAVNPYGAAAREALPKMIELAHQASIGTSLQAATVEATGLASISQDHVDQTWRDFALFGAVAIGAVLLVLVALLRSIVAPLVMVGAVVLSFASAAGVSTLIWQHVIGIDLDWSVFPVAFMALVAVGADYSMLFAARVKEVSHSGVISGIIRGFGSTGSVITTAGLVFALTMFALTSGTVLNLVQIGSTVGLGLILDITIVRTFLLPAAMSLLGRWMWWPSAEGHRTLARSPEEVIN